MASFGETSSATASDGDAKISAVISSAVGSGAAADGEVPSGAPPADAEADDEDDENDDAGADSTKKKKKRKPKKKKKAMAGTKEAISRRLGGFTDYYTKYGQTEPPTKPVADLFKDGVFPTGEIQAHGKTKVPPLGGGWECRTTDEEKREKERLLRPQVYEQVRTYLSMHMPLGPCCSYSNPSLLSTNPIPTTTPTPTPTPTGAPCF